MNGFNKVFLIGYVGSPPEVRLSSGGADYARLHLVTRRPYKSSDGAREPKTDWHHVTVWGPLARVCAERLKKGAPVAVEGYLSHYRKTQDGHDPKVQTSIIAEDVQFLPAARPEPRRQPQKLGQAAP